MNALWIQRCDRFLAGGLLMALVAGLGLAAPPATVAAATAAATPVCDDAVVPPPTTPATGARPLVFGIYAGGNSDDPTSPPDEPAKARRALARLQSGGKPFAVSGRVIDRPGGDPLEVPANLIGYAGHGKLLDVALLVSDGDRESWERFVRTMVRKFGPFARSIQIGHEENFQIGGGTSELSRRVEAIVRGVHVAKETLRQHRDRDTLVGINAGIHPSVDVREYFQMFQQLGGRRFARAVDYVGVDTYPGLPAQLPSYRQAMASTLRHVRQCYLPTAAIPDSTPIHVTENGWPTMANEYCAGTVCYPRRTYAQQAAALDEMVRTVHDYRHAYNVTTYQWFGLRDQDSSVDVKPFDGVPLPSQFGILRDNYNPKPAFDTYRHLIAELG